MTNLTFVKKNIRQDNLDKSFVSETLFVTKAHSSEAIILFEYNYKFRMQIS